MIADCDMNQPDIADPPCLRLSRHRQRVQSQLLYRELVNMNSTSTWQHDHTFGQDQAMPGERRTVIVIIITATIMTVEIAAGILLGLWPYSLMGCTWPPTPSRWRSPGQRRTGPNRGCHPE